MNNQSGFTLLELLIAMALMGLVLVMLYGGLRLGMRSWDAGEQRAESVNEVRLIEDFIRRQLRQSMTVYREDPEQGQAVVFEGQADSLTFVAPLLSYLGMGGLYVIQFDVVQNQGTDRLRMRWTPYRPIVESGLQTKKTPAPEETILVNGVSDLQWEYFGVLEDNQEPQWYDRWPSVQQRPQLVRLNLSVRGQRWPDLVARLAN